MLGRYSELYGQGSTTPEGYRRVLAARMAILLRRHGLLDASESGRSDQGRAAARGFSLDRPPTARTSGEFGPTRPLARTREATVGADQPGLF